MLNTKAVIQEISLHIASRVRSGSAQYFIFAMQLIHGSIVALPGVILMVIHRAHSPQVIWILATVTIISILIFQAMGVYTEEIFKPKLKVKKIFVAWVASFIPLMLIAENLNLIYGMKLEYYIFWFLLTLILLIGFRATTIWMFSYLVSNGFFLYRSVIWGVSESGLELARFLKEHQDIRSGLLGFVDDRVGRLPKNIEGFPLLGNIQALILLIHEEKIHQILIALPWSAIQRTDEIIDTLHSYPVSVLIVPDMLAFRYARNRVSEVGGVPMFNVSDFPLRGWSPLIKRTEDLVLSSVFLVISMPLLLLIGFAIRLDSPGPILFLQKRYGYNNKLIYVYKFRTMFHSMSDADATAQTTRHDVRVTRVGRFLRRSSLDELPQLLNVLTGSMSMVGPRPHATATKAAGVPFEQAIQDYTARHRVKPGITGLAQIHGFRGETDTIYKLQKRVEYDLKYIDNWSISLDLYIVIKTIPSLLFCKEAY